MPLYSNVSIIYLQGKKNLFSINDISFEITFIFSSNFQNWKRLLYL